MNEVSGRVCSKCKTFKLRSEFWVDESKSDGLYSRCRTCARPPRQIKCEPAIPPSEATGRVCSKCKILKARAEFHVERSRPDGMHSCCKVCKGPDKRKKRKLNKEKATARKARWRQRHPEKAREIQRACRLKNKQKYLETQRAWTEANREMVRLKVRLANARRRSNGMRNPIKVVSALVKAQRNRCAVCKASLKSGYHIDHIMPIALGGDNLPKNLQLLCPPCNLSKRHTHPIDFMRTKGFLL